MIVPLWFKRLKNTDFVRMYRPETVYREKTYICIDKINP